MTVLNTALTVAFAFMAQLAIVGFIVGGAIVGVDTTVDQVVAWASEYAFPMVMVGGIWLAGNLIDSIRA